MSKRFGGIKQAYGNQYFLWEIQSPTEKTCLLVSPRAQKKINTIFRNEMRYHRLRCYLQAYAYTWRGWIKRLTQKKAHG